MEVIPWRELVGSNAHLPLTLTKFWLSV